jgi:prepilin peptidase-dependent
MKHTNKKKGFTLVELVIVIAVIAILAGVMIATFSNVVDKANKSADLQEVKSSLDAEYYDFIAEGQLPTVLSVDGNDFVAFSNEIAAPSAKSVETATTTTTTETITTYYDATGKTVTVAEDANVPDTAVKEVKVTVTYSASYEVKNGDTTENWVKPISFEATVSEGTSDGTAFTVTEGKSASYNTVATITGRKGTVFTVTLDVDETSNNFGYYTLEEVE